ncbi:MAG: glycosyltransferase [Candidatus Bathyarchaeia archaeon]
MLTWEFPPRIIGGISSHVYGLSQALANRGIEVHVVTCDFPETPSYEIVGGVHVYRFDSYKIPAPNFLSWVFLMNKNMTKRAVEIIEAHNEQIDLVHAHDWLVANAAIDLKRLYGKPLISTIHSTEQGRRGGICNDYQRTIHSVEVQLVHESSKVICCSEYMAKQVVDTFSLPKEKIVVVRNGVDVSEFNVKTDLSSFRRRYAKPEEKIILYVGRLVYEKGVHVLIGGIPKVLAEIPNVKLVIVGEGGMREELLKEAWDFGIAHKVLFTGFVDKKTLISLYKVSDVAVVPSLYEPFGITALEAMAAQVPVVVSDTGGLAEIVEHDKTGVKIYPDNSDSVAWGILRVLKDSAYRNKLRRNAYMKLLSDYSWNKIAEQTAKIYHEALQSVQTKPAVKLKHPVVFGVFAKYSEEFQVLLLLFTLGAIRREYAKTAKELADILGIKVSHARFLLQKLQKAGYVACFEDNSSAKYYLTKLGIIKANTLFS